jgi:hypothetical protein
MPIQNDIPLISKTAIDDMIIANAQIDVMIPELLNLTPKEKQQFHNIKNKREMFVSKTIEVANHNPAIVPAFASLAYLQQKMTNFQRLKTLENMLLVTLEKVSDTAHNEGHFAYKEALKIFDTIVLAKDSNVPGIDVAHDSLKIFFTKNKRGK